MAIHRVTFRTPDGRETTIPVSDEEHILDAALRHGLDLPSSCLQGWCLTCAARVVAGKVDQRDSRRYFPQDRDAGFALICTGRPARSPIVLETDARDAMRRVRAQHRLPYPRGDWGNP